LEELCSLICRREDGGAGKPSSKVERIVTRTMTNPVLDGPRGQGWNCGVDDWRGRFYLSKRMNTVGEQSPPP
jgi:hypothetical protein